MSSYNCYYCHNYYYYHPSTQLPDNVPSSYIGKFGNVTYTMKATVTGARSNDTSITSEPFLVLRRWPLPSQALQDLLLARDKRVWGACSFGKVRHHHLPLIAMRQGELWRYGLALCVLNSSFLFLLLCHLLGYPSAPFHFPASLAVPVPRDPFLPLEIIELARKDNKFARWITLPLTTTTAGLLIMETHTLPAIREESHCDIKVNKTQ